MWFKGLVATTCVAILGTIAWLGWQEYQSQKRTAEREEMRHCIREKVATVEGMTDEIAGLQCAFVFASD